MACAAPMRTVVVTTPVSVTLGSLEMALSAKVGLMGAEWICYFIKG